MIANTSLVTRAHDWIKTQLCTGEIAIDATVGNGHDTLFLAQTVGAKGKVYGFDIQQDALDTCYQRLVTNNADKQVSLHHAGHETLPIVIPETLQHGEIKAVMFNLGYLPGGDKQRTTYTSTTLSALNSALPMLTQQGIITILAYSGHPGGQEETTSVKTWAASLNADNFKVIIETPPPSPRPSPELIIINKLQLN